MSGTQPTCVFILSGLRDYDQPAIEHVKALAPVAVTHVGRPAYIRCDLTVEPLRQFLSSANFKPPYILAGASFGGLTALCYHYRYPQEVAGLLLLDSTHPDQTPALLALLPPEGDRSSEPVEEFRRFIKGFGSTYDDSCEFVRRIESVEDTPLIALVAGRPEMPTGIQEPLRSQLTSCWHSLQTRYSKLSSMGQIRIIPGVGHDVMGQAPGESIRAIEDLLLICTGVPNQALPTTPAVTIPAAQEVAPAAAVAHRGKFTKSEISNSRTSSLSFLPRAYLSPLSRP